MSKPPPKPVTLIHVEMDVGGTRHRVGRLAARERRIYFEYDPAFLSLGLNISPLKFQLRREVVEGPRERLFEGLHGVFSDSLPDGWGRLLMDRKLRQSGIDPGTMTALDRLAYVGARGMGALRYRPEHALDDPDADTPIDLDALAASALKVLDDAPDVVIDQLLALGGSPAGARPKALVGLSRDEKRLVYGTQELDADFTPWLIKFRAREDAIDAGAVEHAYAAMAKAAGIDMPETRLFPSRTGPGFFGIRRFDRIGHRRLHVLTASGSLDADWTNPSMDYDTLLKLTRTVTRNQVDVDRMFLRMTFNVLAHNRDAHPKNHAFVMSDSGGWTVSPAYDVTYASGPGGEHALAVSNAARDPTLEHVRQVARNVGVKDSTAADSVERVRAAVDQWPQWAKASGVTKQRAAEIDLRLNGARAPKSKGKA